MKLRSFFVNPLTFFIICVISFNISIFGRIFVNGSGSVYGEGDSGSENSVLSGSNVMEYYVIEGAGYYLNAYSDILQFLNMVELSNGKVNRLEWLSILDKSILNLDLALDTYNILIYCAQVTPYNEAMVSFLKGFDYSGFMMDNSLNSSILTEVEEYLKTGDVTGTYKYIQKSFIEMLSILKKIRMQVYFNRMPLLRDCWKLNEMGSTTLLFGQYIARIFLTY